MFRWDTRELALKLETPDDPELTPLIERLDRYYGPKLPQFRPYLLQILAVHGVDPPASLRGAAPTETPDDAPPADPRTQRRPVPRRRVDPGRPRARGRRAEAVGAGRLSPGG